MSSQQQHSMATNLRVWSTRESHKIIILFLNKIPIALPEPGLSATVSFHPPPTPTESYS